MKYNVVVSCEHGGHQNNLDLKIPKSFLTSHRGYDRGAKEIAIRLAKSLGVKAVVHQQTRLIIDYNRSLHHPALWSKYSKSLADEIKNSLIKKYQKYRQGLEKLFKPHTIHFSVHSFTPILNGIKRNCDFALLYDPARPVEKKIAVKIKKRLTEKGIPCRLNYPYKGSADGLTTYFRKIYQKNYAGIELEFNQSIVEDLTKINQILRVIRETLQTG